MKLRSRTTKIFSPVDDGDEDGREDKDENVSDDDDEVYEDLSSEFDDDSDFRDGDDDYKQKRNSLKRKERRKDPKNDIEVEMNDHVDDIPQPIKNSKENKGRRKKKVKPSLTWKIWEEEHEKWIDENEDKDFDLENLDEMMIESAEAPSDMNVELLKYQKEWLAWALKQESSPIRGGILADEMGMGKTVQAIALVLAKRELSREACASSSQSSSSGSTRLKGTLVICPVVAVSQWVGEIDKFTAKGSTKVLVYYGPKREKYLKQFSEYDFVITTYTIIESEYRKYLMPPRDKCPVCNMFFDGAMLKKHRNYFCQSSREDFFKPPKAYKCKNLPSKEKSPLYSETWERIILDEAHCIKGTLGNTKKGVLALESTYRWGLSGTPIQNSACELYSLIRFFRVVPYSIFFCKTCDCTVRDHRPHTQCSNCTHKVHYSWWNKYVVCPMRATRETFSKIKKKTTLEDDRRRAMILLKHKLLKMFMLRRTKKCRAADLALPPKIITLRTDTMDVREVDFYRTLYSSSLAKFDEYVGARKLNTNYIHVFQLLARLRQAVDHPYLVTYSASTTSANEKKVFTDMGELLCGICHKESTHPVVLDACKHVICRRCWRISRILSCPTCSELATVDLKSEAEASNQSGKSRIKGYRSSSILNRFNLENFRTSTKIEALREEIRFMVERDRSAKGIVFSQYTTFLDLISYSLQMSGVKCARLDGSMGMGERDAAVKTFVEDRDCRIFLTSLRAAGVALNLTVASHVFMMEPCWNPFVERQAQARIHRIGQYKPIRVVRFVMENTVEEKILELQEKKDLLFEGTIGGSSEAIDQLSEWDIKMLFNR